MPTTKTPPCGGGEMHEKSVQQTSDGYCHYCMITELRIIHKETGAVLHPQCSDRQLSRIHNNDVAVYGGCAVCGGLENPQLYQQWFDYVGLPVIEIF